MVESEGIGFKDFTTETAISGTANVSGNIVAISGAIAISGEVSIVGDFTYKGKTISVPGVPMALGSGLATSGYAVYNVIIKNPEVSASGALSFGFVFNSGSTAPYVYIGGASGIGSYPQQGSGYMASSIGYPLAPGESRGFQVDSLSKLWAVAETSGTPLSYIVEMR